MIRYDAGTTNPTLLNRLCDWRDHDAWVDFVTRYDPVIRLSCRGYWLSAELVDELSQRVWIDLARRMRTFRYDPGKTFRGWLRRLCQSRAIDLLRKSHLDIKPSNILLDGQPDGPWDQVTPMIADFGIARAGDDTGAEGDRSDRCAGYSLVHGSETDSRGPHHDRSTLRRLRAGGHALRTFDRTASVPGRVADRDP